MLEANISVMRCAISSPVRSWLTNDRTRPAGAGRVGKLIAVAELDMLLNLGNGF
jgi:hypothetical protein